MTASLRYHGHVHDRKWPHGACPLLTWGLGGGGGGGGVMEGWWLWGLRWEVGVAENDPGKIRVTNLEAFR